jgi:hypothetical protein
MSIHVLTEIKYVNIHNQDYRDFFHKISDLLTIRQGEAGLSN